MEQEHNSREMRRMDRDDNSDDEVDNIEELDNVVSDDVKIPSWKEQLTIRGAVASVAIGVLYSVLSMKMGLTTGLVPNLNVSAALISFVVMRSWTKLLEKTNMLKTPFTKQENQIINTAGTACYTMTYGGGFGSYLLGMNRKTYELAGGNVKGNSANGLKEPGLDWMITFLFVTAFAGIMALIPLRKILVIDYKLPYPTGTATAVLINGFHTPKGDKQAKKQVRGFLKYFSFSFLWGCFQWFYTGGANCGFLNFPTFGLKARTNSFYFDFSLTYVGAGMICSHLVNLSLLFGAVLSWGLMWPLIRERKGDWFPANVPESSMESLNGYKVFVPIALILGDGLYNLLKTVICSVKSFQAAAKLRRRSRTHPDDSKHLSEEKRNKVFLQESIPMWLSFAGYIVLSILSIIIIPVMFPQLKWYYVLLAYIIAPALSFCNAYGAGLTDMNMGYNYGKAAIFLFAGVAGTNDGIVAGLIGCGLIKAIVSISADLMQDFKTGHLTLTSPRAMLVSQLFGTAVGCIVAPLTFFLFYNAFDVGDLDSEYKAPYALIYRNMAILGVRGLSALPSHCLQLCYGFFTFAVAANLLRDFVPKKFGKWIPLPMAMAVPFLVGGYFAIDMCVGTLINFVWQKVNKKKADLMIPAVASGLMCGDGLWNVPASVLGLAKVKPPMCMNFLKGAK
ncbi:transporter [Lithospermum erythrorhizon]|uniref:Transporter n=1 Tax=Lithospermum erythrorhizon TaxID=34254 RepID=A0AAV3NHD2_LITER